VSKIVQRNQCPELFLSNLRQDYESYMFYYFRGCDACEEWYHGDCINITEKEAKHIKQFFCVVSE